MKNAEAAISSRRGVGVKSLTTGAGGEGVRNFRTGGRRLLLLGGLYKSRYY